MAKVYVSSTFDDLERERQAVMDWLVAARHQPVHSYRPSSGTTWDSCLGDVDECDLYVLIQGHRYGFRPEEGNPEGLSITHLEFRRAGQSGIPRIALLRPDVPGASFSDTLDSPQAALVAAFRAEVTGEVRAAEFGDLQGLIQGLSTGVQAELDKLPRAGRVLRLAPRPPLLAGREELLAELDARLTVDGGAAPQMVALCGLGGAGKTSVALECAHRHLAEVAVAWQFAAEDPAVLAAGFGELAAQLGVLGQADNQDPVASVHGALASSRAGWLLVFDNAPSRAAMEAFLPPAGRGRVLITSQNPDWPGQTLDVPVLAPDVAAGFLVSRTRDPDQQAALELARVLGGLPLALEQAAAYIEATAGSLAGYLRAFRQHPAELLIRGEPAGYRKTVATTWMLALERLQKAEPQAVALLRLLAFCAPEAIPLRLLLRPRQGLAKSLHRRVGRVMTPLLDDPLALSDAIAALRRYSLISPPVNESVSVHRLVQGITRDQMPTDLAEKWRQAAAAVIDAALPTDPGLPENWPAYAQLLPHAQAVLDLTSGGMWQMARYLGRSGSYPAARDLSQLIADAHRDDDAYGPEHPVTLTARINLAFSTGEAGDAAGARDQCAVLLPIVERVLGPEHPVTLTTRANLARWTGAAGDAAGARDQYAALLPIRERVSGPRHPDTLTDRANLARCTAEAGDAAGARDQYAVLLPIEERVLGPEHPDTLITRANLARCTAEAGDAAAARDQYAVLLPIVERVLGPEHRETLTARANLAGWTGRAGDVAGARDQCAALLPIVERVLGPEHPDTLTVRANLARFTGDAGDAAAARDQLAVLLRIEERVLGPEHPETLTVRANLASWTGEAGDAAGARDQCAVLLPIVERVLGPEHPDTLATRSNLTHWTKAARRGRWRGRK